MKYSDVVNNVAVYGLDESIRRAKYPMSVDISELNCDITPGIQKLAGCAKGTGHDQFLTGIVIQFDLTFSAKAWVEAERYHWLDFISSQSTMHRITKFDLDKAYIPYVDERVVEIMKEKVDAYNELLNNEYMKKQAEKDPVVRTIWQSELTTRYLEILYTNPQGFRLTAGITTNYRQLKTIYSQRKTHRLPEWRAFCDWIETLPMSYLITGGKTE